MGPFYPSVILFLFSTVALGAEGTQPIQALLITGGCCHDYTAQKQLVKKGLEARAHIEVTVVQQGGTSTDTKIPLYENRHWADGFDIVLHDECFAEVSDPAWTQRILKPHQNGFGRSRDSLRDALLPRWYSSIWRMLVP